MTKITINNLSSGKVCRAGYKRGERDFTDDNQFIQFKVGELRFFTLAEVKKAFGVRNLKDLEFEVDRLELGSVTAEFYDCEDKFHWAAYLWSGAFRVGTSADRLTLSAA